MKPDSDRARAAVLERMADLGIDKTALAKEADIDYGTAGDFLNGKRWPRLPTLAKIDKALGWEPGTLASVASGSEAPPNVGGGMHDRQMLLNVDPAVYEDLNPAELAEAMATAQAVFLQKVREIRASRVRD